MPRHAREKDLVAVHRLGNCNRPGVPGPAWSRSGKFDWPAEWAGSLATMACMQKVRVAVFPAAGLGTRFLPATKAQPKEMLPLVDRPLIQYVVEEARAAGIERIVIVTGPRQERHRGPFRRLPRARGDARRRKARATSWSRSAPSRTDRPSPTSGRSRPSGSGTPCCRRSDLVGDEPFAVLLGDDIVDADEPCIGQMMRLYERRGNPVIALQEVPRSQTRHYGIVAGERRRGPRRRDHRHGREAAARTPRRRTSPSSGATCCRRRSSESSTRHARTTSAARSS